MSHTLNPLGFDQDLSSSHDSYLPTPTTRLARLFPHMEAKLWAKMEQLQISGSAKERSAHFLLEGLARDGSLTPGACVVESTSGNLGVALARQCSSRGLRFVAVVDETLNDTTRRTMLAYGATIDEIPRPKDGNRLAARVARVQELLAEIPGAVTVDQYRRQDNPRAHSTTTMPELVAAIGGPPTHLYVATSTAGTILGCRQAITDHGWSTRLVGVDVVGSALFGGEVGQRKLPGLGAGFETALSCRVVPDEVKRIDEADMVRGCRLVARREGLLVGASTGAIVAAIGQDARAFGPDDVVAMLVHDAGAPYLTTVFDDEWVRREISDPERALGVGDEPWPFMTPLGAVAR